MRNSAHFLKNLRFLKNAHGLGVAFILSTIFMLACDEEAKQAAEENISDEQKEELKEALEESEDVGDLPDEEGTDENLSGESEEVVNAPTPPQDANVNGAVNAGAGNNTGQQAEASINFNVLFNTSFSGSYDTDWLQVDASGLGARNFSAEEVAIALPTDNAINTTGLLWYFQLDGTAGSTVSTSVGALPDALATHPATFSDAGGPSGSYEPAINNQGITFLDDEAIYVSSTPALDGEMSLSMWIKPSATGQMGLFYQGNSTDQTAMLARISTNNTIEVIWRDDYIINDGDTSVIEIDKWTHIAIVRSGVAGNWQAEIYLNGVLDYTVPSSVDPFANNSSTFIGVFGPGQFLGLMDEISLWSRPLSSADVATLYKKGLHNGYYQGVYESAIIDSENPSTEWKQFEWKVNAPAGLGLPGAEQPEVGYDASFSADSNLLNGLAGLWHFDGSGLVSDSADSIVDGSGNSLHGTLFNGAGNVTYESGKFNTAINFSNFNPHYVEIDDDDQLDFGAGMTISFWHYLDSSLAGVDQYFISKYLGADGSRSWTLYNNSSNELEFAMTTDGTLGTLGVHTGPYVPPLKWHHIALSYDGSNIKFYLNGQETHSSAQTGNIFASPVPVTIGLISGWTNYFKGLIDELAFWNRGLSAAEVGKLYLRGAESVSWQYRLCSTSDCSDASFVGPDNTVGSFFTPAQATSFNDDNFFSYPFTGLTGQFFQYRILFDSTHSLPLTKVQEVRISGE